jgi:hypothetical protein
MFRMPSIALVVLAVPGIVVLNAAVGCGEYQQMVSLTYQYDNTPDTFGGFLPATITKLGVGAGAEAEGAGQNFYGSYFDTIVKAKTSLLPDGLLHAAAGAISVGNFAYGSDAKAIASAGYRDTITVVNGAAPDILRLRFGVEGVLQASNTVYPAGSTFLVYGVTGGSSPASAALNNWNNSFDDSNGGFVSLIASNTGIHLGNAAGFNTSLNPAGGYSVWGEVDIDVPLINGQYDFAVILSAYAYAAGPQGTQSASSDFGNTLTFQGVSLIDGTPVDPHNLRFDSGLSFDSTPVPEPSTWVLAVTGVFSLGLLRLRSKCLPGKKLPG